MPYTREQLRLFGADLARVRKGLRTWTGMTEQQLTTAIRKGAKRESTHSSPLKSVIAERIAKLDIKDVGERVEKAGTDIPKKFYPCVRFDNKQLPELEHHKVGDVVVLVCEAQITGQERSRTSDMAFSLEITSAAITSDKANKEQKDESKAT